MSDKGDPVMRKLYLAVVVVFSCLVAVSAVACAEEAVTDTSGGGAPDTALGGAVSTDTAPAPPTRPVVWTDLAPAGAVPAARAGQALVYAENVGKVILFGGWDGVDLNDTWAYDPVQNTWTDLAPSGEVPSARHDHALVYDSATGKLVLFGGISASDYMELDDTWAYDPEANTWTDLAPAGALPQSRCLHSLVYDPVGQKVILFGGSRRGGCLGDMWAYDSAANTWTELSLSGDKPLARYGCSLVYDPDLSKILLFGGSDGHLLGDTWAYDPAVNQWGNLLSVDSTAIKPAAREFYAMAYESENRRTVVFGGCGVTALGDAWAYDSATNAWTSLEPGEEAPSARTFTSMVYATGVGRLLLFGGSEAVAASSPVGDTWSCDLTP